MPSTFIRYRGRTVAVPEAPLICIGYMLFHEASVSAKAPSDKSRLEQMNREWDIRARECGVGCANLGLEQVLQEDLQRETEFLSFVNLVRDRLRGFDEELPVEYVNQVIAVGIPDYRDQPIASQWFHKILNIIEALICGEPIPPDWTMGGDVWPKPGSTGSRGGQ